ncbi:hypothetical protein EMGBD4_16550 [Verrucomicrobiota bacterium]|nr:hypothetical protein EMGBD4_16550 [Verrucomicrobiota bacterium]
MVGAYQDIMGDLHNLFGRVNEAHVFLEDDERMVSTSRRASRAIQSSASSA